MCACSSEVEAIINPHNRPLRAAELVKAGAKTIGDLRKPEYYETLSPSQKTFLDFQHILHDPSDLQTAQRVQVRLPVFSCLDSTTEDVT